MIERELGVDPHDFRRWVCLHEETHRLQFTAVPWLRDYVQQQMTEFLLASELDPAAILQRMRAAADAMAGAVRGGDGGSLIEAVATPAQREIMDRLTAVMTLVEGHGDYVMDAVGPQVVPTVAQIREKFNARRGSSGRIEQTLRRMLGIDLKMKQYAEGSRFVRAVVDEAGMATFNNVWASPDTLPTKAEFADPQLWLDRVARSRSRHGLWVPAPRSRRSATRCGRACPTWAQASWCWPPAPAARTRSRWPRRWPSWRPGLGLRGGGVTVDHGLQPGSAERAADVAALLGQLGLDPVRSITVTVAGRSRARRPRPGRPATTPSTRRPANTRPPRSCSGTPWTTRPRPSCSGWPADREAGRWPGCPRGAAPTAGRCSACAARPPPPPAPNSAWAMAGPAQQRLPLRPGPGAPPGAARPGGRARAGGGRGAGPDREPAAGRRRMSSTTSRPRKADSSAHLLRPGRPGLRLAAGAARGDQDPGAARRGDHGGLPARRPDRGARRADRRAGDRLARAALGRPAGRGTGLAPAMARCGSPVRKQPNPGAGNIVGRT